MSSAEFRMSDVLKRLTAMVLHVNGQARGRMLVLSDDQLTGPDVREKLRHSPEREVVVRFDINPAVTADFSRATRIFMNRLVTELRNRGVSVPELDQLVKDLDASGDSSRALLLSPAFARRMSAVLEHPTVQAVLLEVDRQFHFADRALSSRVEHATSQSAEPSGRLFLVDTERYVLSARVGTSRRYITHRHAIEEPEALTELRDRLRVYREGTRILEEMNRQRIQQNRRPLEMVSRTAELRRPSAEHFLAQSAYSQAVQAFSQTAFADERLVSAGLSELNVHIAATEYAQTVIGGGDLTRQFLSPEEVSRQNVLAGIVGERDLYYAVSLERAMFALAHRVAGGEDVSFETFAESIRRALEGSPVGEYSGPLIEELYHYIRQRPELFDTPESLSNIFSQGDWAARLVEGLLANRYHPLVVYRYLERGEGITPHAAADLVRQVSASAGLDISAGLGQWVESLSPLIDASRVFQREVREPFVLSDPGDPSHIEDPLYEREMQLFNQFREQLPDEDERWLRLLAYHQASIQTMMDIAKSNRLLNYLELYASRFDLIGGAQGDVRGALNQMRDLFRSLDIVVGSGAQASEYALATYRSMAELFALVNAGIRLDEEAIEASVRRNMERVRYEGSYEDLLIRMNQYRTKGMLTAVFHDVNEMLKLAGNISPFLESIVGSGVVYDESVTGRNREALLNIVRHLDTGQDMEWGLSVLSQLVGNEDLSEMLVRSGGVESGGGAGYTGAVIVMLPGGGEGFGIRYLRASVRDFELPELPPELQTDPREPLHPTYGPVRESYFLIELLQHVLRGNPVVVPEEQLRRWIDLYSKVNPMYENMFQFQTAGDVGSYSATRAAATSAEMDIYRSRLEFLFEAMEFRQSDIYPDDPYELPADRAAQDAETLGITDLVVYRRRIGRGRSEKLLRGTRRVLGDVVPESELEYLGEEAASRARALESAMEKLARHGEYTAVGPGGRLVQVLGVDDEGNLRVREWTLREFLDQAVGESSLSYLDRSRVESILSAIVEEQHQAALPAMLEDIADIASTLPESRQALMQRLARRGSAELIFGRGGQEFVDAYRDLDYMLTELMREYSDVSRIGVLESRLRQMVTTETRQNLQLDPENLYRSYMSYQSSVLGTHRDEYRALAERVYAMQEMMSQRIAEVMGGRLNVEEGDVRWLRRRLLQELARSDDVHDPNIAGHVFGRLLVRLAYRQLAQSDVIDRTFEEISSDIPNELDLGQFYRLYRQAASRFGISVSDRASMQAVQRELYLWLRARGFNIEIASTTAGAILRVPPGQVEEEVGRYRQLMLSTQSEPQVQEELQVQEEPQPQPTPNEVQPDIVESAPSYWRGHEEMLEALGFSAEGGLYGARRRRFQTVFGWGLEMESPTRELTEEELRRTQELRARAFEGTATEEDYRQMMHLLPRLSQYAVGNEYLDAMDDRVVYNLAYSPIARALYHLITNDPNSSLSMALRRTYLGAVGGSSSGLELLEDLGQSAFAFAAEFVRTTPPGARIAQLGGVIMPSDPDELAEFLRDNLLRLMIAHARGAREAARIEARTISLDTPISEGDEGDTRTVSETAVRSLTMLGEMVPTVPDEGVEEESTPPPPPTPPDDQSAVRMHSSFAEAARRFDNLSRYLQMTWHRRQVEEQVQELQRRAEEARLRNILQGTAKLYSPSELAEVLDEEMLQRRVEDVSIDTVRRLQKVIEGINRAQAQLGQPPFMSIGDLQDAFRRFRLGHANPPEGFQSEEMEYATRLWNQAMQQYSRQLEEWEEDAERRQARTDEVDLTPRRTTRRTRRSSDVERGSGDEARPGDPRITPENTFKKPHDRQNRGRPVVRPVPPRPNPPEVTQFYRHTEETFENFLKIALGEEQFNRLMEAWRQSGHLSDLSEDATAAEPQLESSEPEAPVRGSDIVVPERPSRFAQMAEYFDQLSQYHQQLSAWRQEQERRRDELARLREERETRFQELVDQVIVESGRRPELYLAAVSDILTDLNEGRITPEEARRMLPGIQLVGGAGAAPYTARVQMYLNDEPIEVGVFPDRRVSVAGRVLSLEDRDETLLPPQAVQHIPQQIERPIGDEAIPATVSVVPDEHGMLRPVVSVSPPEHLLRGRQFVSVDIETDPSSGRFLQAGMVFTDRDNPDQTQYRLFLADNDEKAREQLRLFIEQLDATYQDKSVAQRKIAEALALEGSVVQRAFRSEDAVGYLMEHGAVRSEREALSMLADAILDAQGRTLVVQNIAYDIPFIVSRLAQLGEGDRELVERASRLANQFRSGELPIVDVAELAVRQGYAQVNLQALARATGELEPSQREAHLALEDAVLAQRVFERLAESPAQSPQPIGEGQYLVGLGPGRLYDVEGMVPEQVIGLRDRVFRVASARYSTEQQRFSLELEELAFRDDGVEVLRRLRFEPMLGDQDVHPAWQASLEMGRMFTVADEEQARRVYQLGMQDAVRREIERILAPDLPPSMTVSPGQLPSQYEREGLITSMMTVLRARAIAEGVPEQIGEAQVAVDWVRSTLRLGDDGVSNELAFQLAQRAAYYLTTPYARDPRRREVYEQVWQWWNEQGRGERLGELMTEVVGRGRESELSWAEMTHIWRQVISEQIERAGLPTVQTEVPFYRQNVMELNLALPRGGFATISVPTDLPQMTQEAMILHRVRTQLRRQVLAGEFGEGEAVSQARRDIATLAAMLEAGEDVRPLMSLMAQRRLIALQMEALSDRLSYAGPNLHLEARYREWEERSAQLAREVEGLSANYADRVSDILGLGTQRFYAELERNAALREALDEYVARVALPVDTLAAANQGMPDVDWSAPDPHGSVDVMGVLRGVMRPPQQPLQDRVLVEQFVPSEIGDLGWETRVQSARAATAAQRLQLDYGGVRSADLYVGVPIHSATIALHRVLSEAADAGVPVTLADLSSRMRELLGQDVVQLGRYNQLNLQSPTAAADFVQYLMRSAGWIRRYTEVIDEDWLMWVADQMARLNRRASPFEDVQLRRVEAPVTTPFPEQYMDWVVQAWQQMSGAGEESLPFTGFTPFDQLSGSAARAEVGGQQSGQQAGQVGARTSDLGVVSSTVGTNMLWSFAGGALTLAMAAGAYLYVRRRRKRSDDDESGESRVVRRIRSGTGIVGSSRFVVQADPTVVQPGGHFRFDSDWRRPSPHRLRRMERDMEGLI